MLIVCDIGIRIRNIEKVMDFSMRFTLSRASMGAEKIFCGESSGFLFGFEPLFGFLYGVCGSV